MMNENVLVTGGSGFIGTWVLHELMARGARPIVVDLQPAIERWQELLGDRAKEIEWTDASLTDRDGIETTLRKYEISRVIHLAAMLTPDCQSDPWLGCHVNVMGSTAVFDAARRSSRVKTIAYASSYAVYGEAAEPVESGAESAPNSCPPMFYGAFKMAVDLIAEQYWRHHGIASVAIRPHVVYGPLREVGLTAGPSLAARAAVAGEPYQIGYTGNVCYDYVEDVAKAFVRAAFEVEEGAIIVDLPGELASTHDFADAIVAAVPASNGTITVDGPAIPANVPPTPNYISNLFPDWHATTLLDGVKKTADFYRR